MWETKHGVARGKDVKGCVCVGRGGASVAVRGSAASCCSALARNFFSFCGFYSLWDGRLPESTACAPPILMRLVG